MLDVALDKASYKPGETAKLRIASKQGGKALVAVLGNGLLSSTQEVEIAKGGGDVDITVGDNWGPGAYATALLYRPMDEAGEAHAEPRHRRAVDRPRPVSRTLKVALATEAKIKSGSTLTVPVKIDGLRRRRGSPRHGCRRRRRHPEPHALSGARARAALLRSAQARPRAA